jgi:hypothetical protein
MKIIYLASTIAFAGLAWVGLTSLKATTYSINTYHGMSAPMNSGGSPVARTGAPGEITCTGCHSGTVQDGNLGANLLSLDNGTTTYDANSTHELTLTFVEGAVKNGFQLTVLDETNTMAGSLSVIDGNATQLQNGANGRQYITHRLNGTNQSQWTFDWTTPEFGGDVTFYVATNRTNNGNNSSGDVIYTSQHVFTAENTASISEQVQGTSQFELGYRTSANELIIDGFLHESNVMSLNVVDLQGKSHFFDNLGYQNNGKFNQTIQLPALSNGLYTITIFVGNRPYSQKIMVM